MKKILVFLALILITILGSSFTTYAIAGTWSSSGNMATARGDATATLLNNGKVLVVGGYDGNSTYYSSAELYDPNTNTWSSAGNMSIVRYAHTATLLNNGKVLIAGGWSGTDGEQNSAELYDPNTNTWSSAGNMITARYYHTATLLNNGKVLVAGHFGASEGFKTELYDPGTNTWSSAGNMFAARSGHTAVLLSDGKVLVSGGEYFDGNFYMIKSAEIYSPSSNTWSSAGNMSVNRTGHKAVLLSNGKVLVAGGWSGSSNLSSVEVYDPSTNTWSNAMSMSVARYGNSVVMLNDGKVLIAGGWDGSHDQASAELYDPTANTWSNSGSMNTARDTQSTVLLNNGKVLIIGGWDDIGNALASAEIFDNGIADILPVLTLSTPTNPQTIDTTGIVIISGTLTDPDSSQTITITATVAGVLKQTTVATPVTNAAWSLSWTGGELAEGNYPADITVTASDGTGSGTAIYTGDITIDKTAPTLGAISSTGQTNTTIAVTASATDTLTAVQYMFNINGVDTSGWQAGNTYTFTGLAASTSYTIKYMAKDAVGNTSAYSSTINVSTTAAPDTTPPTVNTPTSTSVTSTSITAQANAADPSTPIQYLFNIGGVDQGTWQASNSYTFSGLTANTAYVIKYKAKDSAGNISAYSGTINVTTLASGGGGIVVPTATITEVRDLYNNDNASDIRIIFKGAADESKIASYKVIAAKAVGTQPTDTVGSSLTIQATNTVTGYYVSESKKGNGRLHLFTLPSKMRTYDDQAINQAAGALKVYVLSIATAGNTDKLSIGVDLMAVDGIGHVLSGNNDGYKVTASTPTAADIGNAGNGSDMRVSFKKPESEVNILEYAIIVQKTSSGDLAPGGEMAIISAGNCTIVAKSNVVKTYTINMTGAKDSSGVALANDAAYKVYIVALGTNNYANVLSTPSKPITLLSTVPAALPVRNLSAAKVGSGHTGSNISVTFNEPLAVTNVQEYRIFICTGAGTLDAATANGLDNTRYIKVDSTAKGAAHIVVLTGLNNIHDGTALAVGDYKVYVLTVGKTSTYANRLTGPSKVVKLD